MKKIIATPIILALLAAGSYGVCGYMAKKNFDTAMEEIRAQVPSQIKITYKQGFLSSTVDLQVKLPIADDNIDFELGVVTRHTIYHGPFVFHAMGDNQPSYIPVQAYTEGTLFYEITGDIDEKLAQSIKEASTTTISAHVPFIGDAHVQFSGEPFAKEFSLDDETLAVEWQGFVGSITLLDTMRDFTYNFVAPSLTMSTDGPEKFEITNLTSSGTARSSSFDIGLGEYKAGIKNMTLSLSDEPGDTIVFEDMQVKLSADEQNGLLIFSEYFDINSMLINNKTYGPANTTIHIKNIDAKTVSTINHEYIELQKTHGPNQEALQAEMMKMVTTHGVTLLSKSPELEFENISLKTSEGTGALSLKISFNGEGEVVMNPFFLLGRLSAEASFGADERFLAVLVKEITKETMCDDETDPTCDQQAAHASSRQLQELLANKQLILENGRYTASVSYKDGAAVLNDRPMPLF